MPHAELDELVEMFGFEKLSRAPARFDAEELRALNAKLLHILPYEAVAERLTAMGVGGGEAFWNAVRGNLAVLGDAEAWWRIVHETIEPEITDRALCDKAAMLLPPEPWDEGTWPDLVGCGEGRDGREGQGVVRTLAACAHGPRAWA